MVLPSAGLLVLLFAGLASASLRAQESGPEEFAYGVSMVTLGEDPAYLISSGVDGGLVSRLVRVGDLTVVRELRGSREAPRWFLRACSVGDLDGDGYDEVASTWMFRDESEQRPNRLTILHEGRSWEPFAQYECRTLLPLPDLDGAGGREVATLTTLPRLGDGTWASVLRIVTPATGAIRAERRLADVVPALGLEMCWVDGGDRLGRSGNVVVQGKLGGAGRVALLSSEDASELWSLPLELHRYVRPSLVGIEDLDGDGVTDFGLVLWRGDGGGIVLRLHSGRNGALLHRITEEAIGATAGDRDWGTGFCSGVVSLGDVNEDGVPDVSIGADGLGLSNTGGVFTFSGKDAELLYSVAVPDGADYFGAWLTRVADRDGDGVSELLVGTTAGRGRMRNPRVYVVSGREGRVLSSFGREDLVLVPPGPK